jgi:hippurate hydrolase
MHNWPELPPGEFGVMTGPVMASADYFEITVRGRGGHAAMPHQTVDPMVVAAQMVLAVQTLVSRNLSPIEAGVISITQMRAGSAVNVIADEAMLSGTVRALTPEVRKRLEDGLRHLAGTLPAAFGAEAGFLYRHGYPPTINHPGPTELAARVAGEIVGPGQVHRTLGPSMGAEDFAYMLNARPGCYVWVGQGGSGGCMLHNPRYDFNDDILPLGASYWARLVETALPR